MTLKREVGKVLFMIGVKHRAFGLGFEINFNHGLSLELGFVWLAIEW